MAGYTCPFCGKMMIAYNQTIKNYRLDFEDTASSYHLAFGTKDSPAVGVRFYSCPNDECKKTSIIIDLVVSSSVVASVSLYPRVNMAAIPDYVPKSIREDYEEACLILNDSPKAAATLCRRCLQSMIRDFHGIKDKKNLFEEIDALKDRIRPDEWSTLDDIRQIGNIGAHMEKDVDLIIDIDPSEAQLLIDTIVQLIDAWYITRHKTEERRTAIAATKDRIKGEQKGSKAQAPTPAPATPQPKEP